MRFLLTWLLIALVAVPSGLHANAHAHHGKPALAHHTIDQASAHPFHALHHIPVPDRPDVPRDHDLKILQCLIACMAIETPAIRIGRPTPPAGERLVPAAVRAPEGMSPPCPDRPPRRLS